MQQSASAIPDFYYALFAFYEPALTILGFIGAVHDPETVSVLVFSFSRTSDDNITDTQYPSAMASR
jgi:hypothetical protein